MLDTILVIAIVAIAALYVGRRLYRQFSAKTPSCGCSGCGQARQCGSIKDAPGKPEGCDKS